MIPQLDAITESMKVVVPGRVQRRAGRADERAGVEGGEHDLPGVGPAHAGAGRDDPLRNGISTHGAAV
jgi:hypothetical protein